MAVAFGGKAIKEIAALSVIGGALPLPASEFARRAHAYYQNPQENMLFRLAKECQRAGRPPPPVLGVFNDIPCSKLREDEVQSWARAGFSFVVSDGEHSQWEARLGRDHTAMILRAGMVPVQRLHREAISEHGDALATGSRATMRPYGTTLAEAEQYFRAITYPVQGSATPDNRGGFPMRAGDRSTLGEIRELELGTQGWLQFETAEYISETNTRDAVLDLMVRQGPYKACGFVGPRDAALRSGDQTAAIEHLVQVATEKGVLMGTVCGGDSVEEAEESMTSALRTGFRLLAVGHMTSDLPYVGARSAAEPFFAACARLGF